MQENNELRDILLDKDENKNSKGKKILIIVAVFILLFISVIIGVKLTNKKPEQNLQEVSNLEPITNPKQEFEQVPIIDKKKQNFQELLDELQKEDKAKALQPLSPLTKPDNETKQEISPEKPEVVAPPAQTAAPVAPAKPERPANTRPAKPKQSKKEVSKIKPGAYIQVSSIEKIDQTSALFRKLKRNNYAYEIYKTKLGNREIYKILVGPFSSAQLGENLVKIKREIQSDAFIFRVK